MEIVLDKRAVRQIHLAAQEAIEEGDIESLRESIMNQFTDDQIEEIERRLESGDFYEFLSDCLMEWSGEEEDEEAIDDETYDDEEDDEEFEEEDDEEDDE
jgi:hypothetical protein